MNRIKTILFTLLVNTVLAVLERQAVQDRIAGIVETEATNLIGQIEDRQAAIAADPSDPNYGLINWGLITW